MSAKRSADYGVTFGSTIGSVRIRRWDIRRRKRSIFRARERPVENDAADGNPQRTRITTAAWKSLRLSHIFHRPDDGPNSQWCIFSTAAIHLRKVDFLSEGWGVPQCPTTNG